MPSGMSIVTYAAPAISAIVRPLSGEPLTANFPSSLSSMSSGAASRLCAAIFLAFSTSFAVERAIDSPPTASEREP